MLNTFLKAARKLNASGVLDDVLHILLEEALRRTHAHRAFVFVRHDNGALRLLAGRDTNHQKIEEGCTLSRDAASGASEYLALVTDETGKLAEFMPAYSPDRFLCHALYATVFHDEGDGSANKPERPYVQGVVCLDYPDRMPSFVSYGVLKEMSGGETLATFVAVNSMW
jgi:hypothetical protein